MLPQRVCIRSSKYLNNVNNVVEQDHRRIKQRIRPMLGFKQFRTAAVTIRGSELAEKIKKHQFDLKAYAQRLLEMTALTITDVAAQSGFASLTHFFRVFRSRTSQTPRAFRRGWQDESSKRSLRPALQPCGRTSITTTVQVGFKS
jgi:methylphosphotriester-DNA--protein-cysteine methyltransferase